MQRKAWIFVSIICQDFILSFAIVDAGYLGTAFTYVYDRNTNHFYEEKKDIPYAFAEEFRPSLQKSWRLEQGKQCWLVEPLTERQLALYFRGEKLSFSATLSLTDQGINVLAPAKDRPYHYTYKNQALAIEGQYKLHGKKHFFTNDCASIDFSYGYPPRDTFWNWASLLGYSKSGDAVGINLVSPFNDELENCLWFNGEVTLLGKADFAYSKPMDKYNATIAVSGRQKLKIRFFPEGARKENTDLLLLKSQFTQVFGQFVAEYSKDESKTIVIEGFGLLEEHHAFW